MLKCFALSRTLSVSQEVRCSDSGRGKTAIQNNTGHTIVFRDKYRDQFGRLRHSVAPNSEECVSVDISGTDTYYQMGVLTKSRCSQVEGNTNILIDTDDMAVHKRIVVSYTENGDKFVIEKFKRNID